MINLTNQAIIDVKGGNILGKYTKDKVILAGSYLYKDISFVENVDIVINPENGLTPIITKIPYVGYNLELFLGDFNGDEKDEIMVRGEYGGSGGYAIAAIYEYKDNKLVEIFNPDMFFEKYKLIAKYLEGYKVLVESVALNEKYTFDISKKPKIYLDMIYDENGKVKKGEEPIISAINGAFPIKLVFGKNYYLFIRQRVIGVSNADRIGYIESFVNLLNNDIKVVEMGAYQLGEKEDLNNLRKKINRDHNTRCDKHLVDTIKMFLPPTSKIVVQETPFKKPAVKLIDLDGDGILELVGVYYFQGEYYIIILKYYDNAWHVLETVKGKGYNLTYFDVAPITSKYKNNLVVGWQVGAIWSDLSVYELRDTKLKDLVNGNKYFSRIQVKDIESTQEKNGTYKIALWIHDTGDAYRVEIYRWLDNKFVLALDVYPYYFEKVVNYYKKLLKEKDSTTYWYYLADAQIKTGNTKEACQSIDKALAAEFPYPSIEELMRLKKQLCEYGAFSDKSGIDFSEVEYIPSETEKDIQLEQALVKAFDFEEDLGKVRYYYNNVDLNEDGNPEVFVYLVGSPVCGTGGCSGAILKNENGEYTLLSKFTLVNNPVIISNRKTNGYRDIIMYVSGGGIESFFAQIKYDGATYPSNPSVQPKIMAGTKLEGVGIISDDITKNFGIEFGNVN